MEDTAHAKGLNKHKLGLFKEEKEGLRQEHGEHGGEQME